MKKTLLVALSIVYSLASMAADTSDWVISENGKMNCIKILIRNSNAQIILNDGEKIKMPLEEIKSYSHNGKVFNKVNLYVNGKATGKMVFMELVKTREDYRLYKYIRTNVEYPYECYYIYKGDQLCQILDETVPVTRIKSLFGYFGYRAVIM